MYLVQTFDPSNPKAKRARIRDFDILDIDELDVETERDLPPIRDRNDLSDLLGDDRIRHDDHYG